MKILVTGAAGTIGRNVCKKLVDQGHQVAAMGRNLGRLIESCPQCIPIIGDVERIGDINHAIQSSKSEGIIHTAANKYVNACEMRPSLAVKANILGTLNVLESCESLGIEKTLIVSTDKACNHDQIYGMSKYLCEQLVCEYSRKGMHVNCVRFGNVFGSQGSVVPIWKDSLDRKGSITVRHMPGNPEIFPLRFGMTPGEASDFTVRVFTGSSYRPGEVIVKVMRVIDIGTLAKAMVAVAGPGEIEYEEMQFGESLVEWLLTKEEHGRAYLENNEWHIPSISSGNSHNSQEIKTLREDAISLSDTIDFLREILT